MIDCDWAVHVTVVPVDSRIECSFNLYSNTEQRARILCESIRIAARSSVSIELPNMGGRVIVLRASEPYRL